jgi:hypothetical protein
MIDPKTISQTLRRVAFLCEQSERRDQPGRYLGTDRPPMAAALTMLADRLSLDGEPRVGDLVRVYSMNDAPENDAIAVGISHDEVRVYYLATGQREWRIKEELRIVARAPYDAEALLEKRDA